MSAPQRAAPARDPVALPDTVRTGLLDGLGIIGSIVDQWPLCDADVEVVVVKLIQLARDAEWARWREVKRAGFDPRSSVRAVAEATGGSEASFREDLLRRIRSAVDAPPFCGTPDTAPSPSRPRTAAVAPLRRVPAPADAEGGRP